MDYFAIIRKNSSENKNNRLTEGLKNSDYYSKIQKIHNVPIKLTAKHIIRGISDKSVHESVDPISYTFNFWSFILGYIKLLSVTKDNPIIMNTDVSKIKTYIRNIVLHFLQGKINLNQTVQLVN